MAVSTMPYKVAAYGLSDVGLVRQNNEDAWDLKPDLRFYVLTDGMGGHQAGEIAAHRAVELLCDLVQKSWESQKQTYSFHDMRNLLKAAIKQTNATIYKMSRSDPLLKGMGTTLCCLFFHDKGLVYAHVGDSRIYRFRKGKLTQLTKDHSLLRELVDQGHFSEKDAVDFSYKNIITKAIGTEIHVEPSVHLCDIEIGDQFLMCTDGLSDMLSEKEIQSIMNHENSLENCASELIATANAKGGHDNVTVVLTKVIQNDEKKDISR